MAAPLDSAAGASSTSPSRCARRPTRSGLMFLSSSQSLNSLGGASNERITAGASNARLLIRQLDPYRIRPPTATTRKAKTKTRPSPREKQQKRTGVSTSPLTKQVALDRFVFPFVRVVGAVFLLVQLLPTTTESREIKLNLEQSSRAAFRPTPSGVRALLDFDEYAQSTERNSFVDLKNQVGGAKRIKRSSDDDDDISVVLKKYSEGEKKVRRKRSAEKEAGLVGVQSISNNNKHGGDTIPRRKFEMSSSSSNNFNDYDKINTEQLVELLAQFYAHSRRLRDEFELIKRRIIEKTQIKEEEDDDEKDDEQERRQNQNKAATNNSGQDHKLVKSQSIINHQKQNHSNQKQNKAVAAANSREREEFFAKIKMHLGADDESLMKWLRQKQQDKFAGSLKNVAFELLSERPNRTINVCSDGPKILLLPNVSDFLYCYTSEQWIERLWSDLRLSAFHYPIIVLNFLIFLFGTTGNIFVCLSVKRNHQLRSVTNYFIVNLAFADFLVILICLPATVVWDLSLTWFFDTIPCKLIMFLQDVSISVSVLTLTAISIDRYYAICHPLKFKSSLNQAKRTIALIWLVSLALMAPDLIYLSAKRSKDLAEAGLDTVLYSDCNYDWSEQASRSFQFVKTILLYFLPFLLMFCAHYRILKVLRLASSLAQQHQQQEQQQQQQLQLLVVPDNNNDIKLAHQRRGSSWFRQKQQQQLQKRLRCSSAGESMTSSPPPLQTKPSREQPSGLVRQLNQSMMEPSERNRLPSSSPTGDELTTMALSALGDQASLADSDTGTVLDLRAATTTSSPLINDFGEEAAAAAASNGASSLAVAVLAPPFVPPNSKCTGTATARNQQNPHQMDAQRQVRFVSCTEEQLIDASTDNYSGQQRSASNGGIAALNDNDGSGAINTDHRNSNPSRRQSRNNKVGSMSSIFKKLTKPRVAKKSHLSSSSSVGRSETRHHHHNRQQKRLFHRLPFIGLSVAADGSHTNGMDASERNKNHRGNNCNQTNSIAASGAESDNLLSVEEEAATKSRQNGFFVGTSKVKQRNSNKSKEQKQPPSIGGLSAVADRDEDDEIKATTSDHHRLNNHEECRRVPAVKSSRNNKLVGRFNYKLHSSASDDEILNSSTVAVAPQQISHVQPKPVVVVGASAGQVKPTLALANGSGGDDQVTERDELGGGGGVVVGGCGGASETLILTMHNKSKLESRRKAAKMLTAIVVLFGICYLPVHLINFLRQFIDDIPQTDITSTISMLAHCVCYLNSAINPIIYNHMNSVFRAEFRKFLSCLDWRRSSSGSGGGGGKNDKVPTNVTTIGNSNHKYHLNHNSNLDNKHQFNYPTTSKINCHNHQAHNNGNRHSKNRVRLAGSVQAGPRKSVLAQPDSLEEVDNDNNA